MLSALAVILQQPERITVERLDLTPPAQGDVVVSTTWSGISTGTERLLYSGRMPPFPGMGYPLVPGYESVGEIVHACATTGLREGQRVFVPGARCFGPVHGLFGGAASCLVSKGSRVVPVDECLGDSAILLALAATAHHAKTKARSSGGELIIGHGVLGRLVARICMLDGDEPPVVWETNPARSSGATGYEVRHPDRDETRDYRTIIDVSGDATLLDSMIGRLSPGGEIVLGGFYEARLSFSFPPAFMREASLRIAAQWGERDLAAVRDLIDAGRLSLDGLITHRSPASDAETAYRVAFDDPDCLKMVLDWSKCS